LENKTRLPGGNLTSCVFSVGCMGIG